MAVLVILFWMLFPTISLMVFLTISIIHFGLDVARTKQGWMSLVQGYAHGCVVIVGISQSHKEEVLQIYSFLIGKDAGPVWVMIDFISIIFLIVLVFYTCKAILDTKWRLEFIELLVLLILFSQFPPLVSFAIYFCGLHSVRHFRNIWLPLRNTIPLRNICLQIASFNLYRLGIGGIDNLAGYVSGLSRRSIYSYYIYWTSSVNRSSHDISRWIIPSSSKCYIMW